MKIPSSEKRRRYKNGLTIVMRILEAELAFREALKESNMQAAEYWYNEAMTGLANYKKHLDYDYLQLNETKEGYTC